MQSEDKNNRSGQAMLIAVLSLGGAILGATTVAGLLTLYQIRATTDSANSAKAIFAADAGVEWALFNYYCGVDGRCGPPISVGGAEYAMTPFTNGATQAVDCYDTFNASGPKVKCSKSTTVVALASGQSGGAERAFFLGITGSTTTYP